MEYERGVPVVDGQSQPKEEAGGPEEVRSQDDSGHLTHKEADEQDWTAIQRLRELQNQVRHLRKLINLKFDSKGSRDMDAEECEIELKKFDKIKNSA